MARWQYTQLVQHAESELALVCNMTDREKHTILARLPGFRLSWRDHDIILRLISQKPLTGLPFEWEVLADGTMRNKRFPVIFLTKEGIAHDARGSEITFPFWPK